MVIKSGITALTPTGDRQIALERCRFYLERQTLKPDQWLVVDDGSTKHAPCLKTSLPLQVVTRNWTSNRAVSFTGNILDSIPHIKYDHIIIIEDDDWYHESYIERTFQRLREVDICGQPNAVYYNVRFRRYRINRNSWRASFCETAFKANLLPKLKKLCLPRTSAFIDSRLWRHCIDNKVPNRLYEDERLCIGIKGLPGRTGIGIGHRPSESYKKDPDWRKLMEFIGEEDSSFYMKLFRGKL